MSKAVELVLVTKQKIIVVPKVKPTIVEGGLTVVRMRYSEPRFN